MKYLLLRFFITSVGMGEDSTTAPVAVTTTSMVSRDEMTDSITIWSDVSSVLTDQGQENVDTMVAASFGKKSMMSAEVKSVSQAVDDDSEMMMSAVVVGFSCNISNFVVFLFFNSSYC